MVIHSLPPMAREVVNVLDLYYGLPQHGNSLQSRDPWSSSKENQGNKKDMQAHALTTKDDQDINFVQQVQSEMSCLPYTFYCF